MNIIDKTIAVFAPRVALKRARANMALRLYEGATPGRRGMSWRGRRGTAANAEIATALRELRDRARDLARNNPHAARALDLVCTHTIGTGLRAISRTKSKTLDKRVMSLWHDWEKKADVEGELSFGALQGLAVRSMMESGEVVVRFIDRKLKDSESKVPLQLQVLESDFIDQWREGFFQGEAGIDTIRSRLGVGLGEFDRRTGLWLLPYHPGEITVANMRPGISKFVPRENIIHMFRKLRPGQVRGVPWFAPVMSTSRELADFIDAVIVKARVEACFAGFITNSDEYEQLMEPMPNDRVPAPSLDNPNAVISALEPGMLKELKSGQDIKFAQPTTATQIEPLLMYGLQSIAAGIGCTYDQLSGDLRGANYSSLRAGKLDFRRLIKEFQDNIVVPMLCQRVWERFIDRAILAGELKERTDGYPVDWVRPTWEAINPKLDLDAEMNAVRAGRISPQEFIAAEGNDYQDMLDKWEEWKEECTDRGLTFDVNPWQVTKAGSPMPPPVDPNAPQGAPPVDPNAPPTDPNAPPTDDSEAGADNGYLDFDDDGNEINGVGRNAAADPFESSALRRRDFDPNEPRVPEGNSEGGEWTSGGASGGASADAAGGGAAASKPALALHPHAINVGGDDWNKKTAVKLETDYQTIKPKIDKIVADAIAAKAEAETPSDDEGPDPDDAPLVPDSWDALSSHQQDEALEKYKDQTFNDYLDTEQTNWFENDAPNEAAQKVAEDFNDGTDTDWLADALAERIDDQGEGETRIPYTVDQLLNAITIEHNGEFSGYGSHAVTKGLEIGFDDDKLGEPDNLPPKEQQTLPGIEPPKPHEQLTEKMRKELTELVEEAFVKEASRIIDKIEPPDYLADSVSEFQEEMWDSMSDEEKFIWVKHATNWIEDAQDQYDSYFGDHQKPAPEQLELPKQYDPLESGASAQDYKRTQRLARYVSRERAAQIIVDRKALDDIDKARDAVADVDQQLWNSWKGSSTSSDGWLLQAAAADEFGGRLRETPDKNLTRDDAIKYADSRYKKIGGYEGVKAYIRGKWETTQYLLDKADINKLDLFRALDPRRMNIGIDNDDMQSLETLSVVEHEGKWLAQKSETTTTEASFNTMEEAEKFADKRNDKLAKIFQSLGGIKDVDGYKQLPAFKIARNGAASTSTDANVSNGWDGDARIVLRAELPRTAALSIPAYGINMQSEHEVVVAGTAWKAWDAWLGEAPTFDKVPIGHQAA